MKRRILLLIIFSVICTSGCSSREQVVYIGNNAIIESVSTQEGGVYVSDTPDQKLFGDCCFIDCGEAAIMVVDFKTNAITDLELEDLQKGDLITIDLLEEELKRIKTESSVKASRVQRIQPTFRKAPKDEAQKRSQP